MRLIDATPDATRAARGGLCSGSGTHQAGHGGLVGSGVLPMQKRHLQTLMRTVEIADAVLRTGGPVRALSPRKGGSGCTLS